MSTNRGRGRPAIGKPLTVRVDDVTLTALEAEAQRRDVKLSVLTRELLRHAANELQTIAEIERRR